MHLQNDTGDASGSTAAQNAPSDLETKDGSLRPPTDEEVYAVGAPSAASWSNTLHVYQVLYAVPEYEERPELKSCDRST